MRTVFKITGTDRIGFLNRLFTRDVPETGLAYAALLTPQGKYLADFFLWQDAGAVYLDVASFQAAELATRLDGYRLRADVGLARTDLVVSCALPGDPPNAPLGTPPPGDPRNAPHPFTAMADPRASAMGWRRYGRATPAHAPRGTQHDTPPPGAGAGRDARAAARDGARVAHGIPEAGRELHSHQGYVLEFGFQRLGGVDFTKGCFVGQEIVARMKHRATLKRGLATVALDGPAEEGATITARGKPVGELHTRSQDRALASLRIAPTVDSAPLLAGETPVRVVRRWTA